MRIKYSEKSREAHQRGVRRSAETRQASADRRATTLAPLIQQLHADGYLGIPDLTRELNARRIPSRSGGAWAPSQVERLCRRLERLGSIQQPRQRRYLPPNPRPVRRDGVDRNRAALTDNADDFARGMAPIIASLRSHGCTTLQQLAQALNDRGVLTRQNKAWTARAVQNLCERLRDMAERH